MKNNGLDQQNNETMQYFLDRLEDLKADVENLHIGIEVTGNNVNVNLVTPPYVENDTEKITKYNKAFYDTWAAITVHFKECRADSVAYDEPHIDESARSLDELLDEMERIKSNIPTVNVSRFMREDSGRMTPKSTQSVTLNFSF